MEDANKIEEVKTTEENVVAEEVKTTEENVVAEEVKDEEFIEVVGDADEVINEKEEEVR